MYATNSLARIPTRIALMPPVVEPADPPMAMQNTMMSSAPLETTVVIWFTLMVWNPVDENAATTVNTPRRNNVGSSS